MIAGSTGAALVVGASGGIGSSLCRRLAARGVPVVATARDGDRLGALSNELGGERGCSVIIGDASDAGHVQACVDLGVERFGAVRYAVNCAGSLLLKPAHLTTPTEFLGVLNANLVTSFNVVRACAPVMASAGGGAVVLCSSAVALHGFANHEAIAAAKAGVVGLMLSAAATYAPKGVRLNCVAPGLTRTPLTERIFSNEASLKASQAMHPLGRAGEADDVAAAIDFLLSDAARHVTGQTLHIDGGLGSVRAR